MAAEPSPPRASTWTGRLPWLRLFRGVRVATDARKLILAAFGLVLLNAGWEGLDRAFPESSGITPPVWRPLEFAYPATPEKFLNDLLWTPWQLTEPARRLVGPFAAVFSLEGDTRTFLHALLAASWAAAVWGLIGGAICRIAVVQVARGERPSLWEALRFAIQYLVPFVGGPLSPLVGVSLFAALCALAGLVYRIPTPVGPVLGGIFLFLPLFAGLIMTLIVAGLAVGWPLMHATVAADAEDGFDALSRSYAYVHQRPGRYASYVALAWLLGIPGILFIDVFARLVIHLAEWGLSFTAPRGTLGGLFGTAPVLVDPTAATAHAFWLFLVGLLVHGWIYSYFWTSAASIYLLLRKDVDGTPWHQIAIPERQAPLFPSGADTAPSPAEEAVATPQS